MYYHHSTVTARVITYFTLLLLIYFLDKIFKFVASRGGKIDNVLM